MKIDQIIHAYNTLTQPRTSHRDGNKAKVSQHFIKSSLGGETLLHFSQTYSLPIRHIRNQDTRPYRRGARLCSVTVSLTRVCMIGVLAPLLVCRRPVLRPRCLGQ